MPVTVKSLNLIHSRQFLRSKSKSRMYGDLIGVVYFWIIEIVLYFILKKENTEIPAMVPALIAAGFLIPDFILKLIFQHDESVMDSFLKTRPVSRKVWNRFLSLYQFRKLSNLLMPLILLPICLLFGPPLPGLATFALAYLASVAGGTVVMYLKRKGDHQAENKVRARHANPVKSAKGNHIFGIMARALLRSKRLRVSIIYFTIFLYLECFSYSFHERSNTTIVWLFLFITMTSLWVPNNGFAVEANFFNGLWTRPVGIRRLLYDKYIYGLLGGAAGLLLCLPLCLWGKYSVPDVISISLYSACFANLSCFVNAYNCVPYDLFGKAFYNQQGRSSNINWPSMAAVFLSMGGGIAVVKLLPGWRSQVILSTLGIAGLCIARPFLRWIADRFMAGRYDYMEKYNSK